MAQVDYFLKIEGIKGESTDAKHKGEIDIQSWSWGASQSGSMAEGGGGGAGKVSMKDFNFVMKASKASPKLMLACATGEHIKEATLVCRKAGKNPAEYLKIVFSDVMVSCFHTGGGADGVSPLDQVSLNFAKIKHEHKEQNADGTLGAATVAGYNLKENVKI
jgi:type VI secretion system secreted protein Hcp